MKVFELIEAFNDSYSSLKEFGLVIMGVYQNNTTNIDNCYNSLNIDVAEGLNESDEIDCKNCHLNIMHPLIFDNRKIPEYFHGVKILNITNSSSIPAELVEMVINDNGFEENFTPNQYRNYVFGNSEYIREVLKSPNMTIDEMLDAICMGDFEEYEAEYAKNILKRLIGN